jgi:hypothetical protein
MKPTLSERHHKILTSLSVLPKKILHAYDVNNLAQIVLHDLCNEQCFNISKAAYFVDNPDFDCFKGIAGYHFKEHSQNNYWQNPQQFTDSIQNNEFYKKVRAYSSESLYNQSPKTEHNKDTIASLFSFNEPHYYSFKMKNDNHGLLIYESPSENITQDLLDGFYFLGFCPLHS